MPGGEMDPQWLKRMQRRVQTCKLVRRAAAYLFILLAVPGGLLFADYFFIPGGFFIGFGPSYTGYLIGAAMSILGIVYGTGYTIGEQAREAIETVQVEDKRNERERKIDALLAYPGEVMSMSLAPQHSENVLILQIMLSMSGHLVQPDGLFNAQTSLAEAVEFLLTGQVVRRELMASAQDEFADALRNAHLVPADEVYVTARVQAPDGSLHEVRRILTADYGKRQDCASRLEIDGVIAAEADLAGLGIVLSQPPLQAPVLAQHTLSYIFSVRPQDRATYFKTLLEVTDLDDLRNEIEALASARSSPLPPMRSAPSITCTRCIPTRSPLTQRRRDGPPRHHRHRGPRLFMARPRRAAQSPA